MLQSDQKVLRILICQALSALAILLATDLLTHQVAAQAEKPQEHNSQANDPTQLINRQVKLGWQENDLKPARRATDGQWCRRVYLDLVGRIPTIEELDAFVGRRSPLKREELVDQLLGEKYQEEYSYSWTTLWTNNLVGRTGGRERRSLINRGALEDYLQQALLENRSYDQLATELITAIGSADPRADDHNGAVNFLVEKLDENGIQATAKTAEIFLGTAVQCTQCHNHPFNEYRQNQFWELNAFFRQARVERMRDPEDDNRRLGRIVNRDFNGEGRPIARDGNQASAAPIYYELRNGQLQVAYPVFIDGTALVDEFSDQGVEFGNSGSLQQVDRRQELARLIVGSRDFDRSLVNRYWAHFFGYGFTKPFDDMGPHNPASHPELLDQLGQAFRYSGFNTKALMRWIVLSEPYALSSRISNRNAKDDPTIGLPRFSRFYVRQMQAEQLYESLLVATRADETVSQDRRANMKDRWLRQFNTAFGTDDGAEATTFNGSIPQTLTMMNGDLIYRACSTGTGSFLDKVASNKRLKNRDKIDYLYRAALSRNPTKEEIRVCNDLLVSRKGDVVGSLQDIWWAILNSNEFILVH